MTHHDPSRATWPDGLATILDPDPVRPLPPRLAARLRAIPALVAAAAVPPVAPPAPRPRLPWWIRDGRLAMAASVLLTFALTFAGDPAVLVRAAKMEVEQRAARLATVGEERGQEVWTGLVQTLTTGVEQGKVRLAAASHPYEEIWQEARRLVEREDWREFLPWHVETSSGAVPDVDSEPSEEQGAEP